MFTWFKLRDVRVYGSLGVFREDSWGQLSCLYFSPVVGVGQFPSLVAIFNEKDECHLHEEIHWIVQPISSDYIDVVGGKLASLRY